VVLLTPAFARMIIMHCDKNMLPCYHAAGRSLLLDKLTLAMVKKRKCALKSHAKSDHVLHQKHEIMQPVAGI